MAGCYGKGRGISTKESEKRVQKANQAFLDVLLQQ